MSTNLDKATASQSGTRQMFLAFKRGFDLAVSFMLLPILALAALTLLFLNPFLNPGPLFYFQDRMGRDCRSFRVWKFRTMADTREIRRGPYDPPEDHRIAPLGEFLRRTRIDELPQIVNVLKGEMSLIGPRPDYLAHAQWYVHEVPGYRERHVMRPGISGYAQVTLGYAATTEGVRQKTAADLYYIRNASVRLDTWIVWRTFLTILHGLGR